jgi:uncharacterized repeat protein (TIGR03806 family)
MKFTAVAVFCFVVAGCGGGGPTVDAPGDAHPYGLDAREAATGVNIPTGPEGGTQLTAFDAFPGLTFPASTFITHAGDGSDRLFVLQRGGTISVITDRATSPRVVTFLDITSRVDAQNGEGSLLGMAFDPDFSSNGYFYVSYPTLVDGPRKVRVSRFQVSRTDPNVADPASERVALEIDHPNAIHFGGWIGFGPDGALYITHGDGENNAAVQDTSSLFGKVLRVRMEADGSASIPSDNPFGNAVWAYGFRNPWRCSFDRANANLWCGDVGEGAREEINLVTREADYGWPLYEGSLPSGDNPNSPASVNLVPPVYEYDHSIGVAVIGGFVYRGSALPGLVGLYLYADLSTPNLWGIKTDDQNKFISNAVLANNLGTTYSLGEDEGGEIYAASEEGTIYGFRPTDPMGTTAQMPGTLSATGLFSDLARLKAAPGVIDYETNSPLWSDGAQKRRWIVLPGSEKIDFSPSEWRFPIGTITIKHFELPSAGGGMKRLETRVMVNRPGGWVGYTYRWREDQSDADLLLTGADATINTVDPETGAAIQVNWRFPSQAQCMNCHTQAAGRVLGLNTLQLNGDHTYERTGRSDNQLRALNHVGLFTYDIGAASMFDAMPDPTDLKAPIESRAKAYLDTNCSACHRPGGPTPVNMDLRYGTRLGEMNIVGVAATRPTTPGALRVARGNHATSDLWTRAASPDNTIRMPTLGTTQVDKQAIKLLADWIDGQS